MIARVSKSNKIWQFIGNSKTLESLYTQAKHHKCSKLGNYNSIKYSYVSAIVTHKTLGKIKIVFIKTKDNLIPIISTNIKSTMLSIEKEESLTWDKNIKFGTKEINNADYDYLRKLAKNGNI